LSTKLEPVYCWFGHLYPQPLLEVC
jgi:hypothetical protein